MRRLLSLAIALALVTPVAVLTAPAANAGTGASQECTNNVTYGSGMEVPIVQTPITFNVEGTAVAGLVGLIVCYSTTPNGSTEPAIMGGSIWFAPENGNLICRQDNNTSVGLGCHIEWVGNVIVVVAPRVQGTSVPVGVSSSGVGSPACLRNVVIYGAVTTIGPFNLGACTP